MGNRPPGCFSDIKTDASNETFSITREYIQYSTSLCTNQLKIYTKLTVEDCAICVLQVEKRRYIVISFSGGNVYFLLQTNVLQLLAIQPFTILNGKDVQIMKIRIKNVIR